MPHGGDAEPLGCDLGPNAGAYRGVERRARHDVRAWSLGSGRPPSGSNVQVSTDKTQRSIRPITFDRAIATCKQSGTVYLEIPFSGKRRDRRRCYHRLQGHSRGASHAGGSHGPPNSERSDAGYLAQEGEHHQDPTPIPDIGREAHSRACATAPPEIPPKLATLVTSESLPGGVPP